MTTRTHFDAALVTYRLEEAGATLLALPGGSVSCKLPSSMPDVVRNMVEAYGYTGTPIKPAIPSAARITRMDEALAWVALIPLDKPTRHNVEPWSVHGGAVLRRIVGARMLVSPVTEKHLFSWRRIGTAIHANHESVRQWHTRGISIIVEALNRQRLRLPDEKALTT